MRRLLCALALASLAIAPTSAQVGRGPGFRSGLKFVSTAAPVVLQTLSLNNNSFPGGVSPSTITTTRNIFGRTAGSTFTGSLANTGGTVSGPTFDNSAGTVTMTRTNSAPSSTTLTITETLAGATGSPKSTVITITT